jgi:UDP-perosamine 4-acetyltransferase
MIFKFKLLLIGAGQHCNVVIDILQQNDDYDIIGCLDKSYTADSNRQIFDVPVIGNDDRMQEIFDSGITKVHIALGDNRLRDSLFDMAVRIGFEPVSIISRNAVISPRATIGKGTVVMPGAVINAGASIGENCIINTNSSVDHDCIISRSCHIAPGCAISGNVKVGEGTHIGTGASVIDKITIGNWSYIGAGAVVVKNIEQGTLAYGVPARKVRQL